MLRLSIVSCFLLTLVLFAPSAKAAFVVEAHESGLAFDDNFMLGGDTFSASNSIPSTAVGLTATNSIFGGDGLEFGDTYIFSFTPGEDEDNFLPAPGLILGSTDGSPGNGYTASGLLGDQSGLYNVYITSPATVNVNGGPSIVTITQEGDDLVIDDLDLNNEMTGPNSQITPAMAFVGGLNNAWYLLGTVDLLAGETYSLTMEASSNTFVSQRVHGVMWERIVESAGAGDVNSDGVIDVMDIDELSVAVRTGETGAQFDVNADGDVDSQDRTYWIETIQNTWVGDSNLDGLFDSSDFVLVFTAGQYEDGIEGNSTWGTGDWDGDGEFGTSDFVFAFTAGGYEAGVRPPGVASVPEPSSLTLLLLGLLSVNKFRRR